MQSGGKRLRYWIIFAAMLLGTAPSWADELKGRVVETDSDLVYIRLDDDRMPKVGDPLVMGSVVSGVGLVPIKGRWRVSSLGQGMVEAEPAGETAIPQNGFLVSILTPEPQYAAFNADQAARAFNRGEKSYFGKSGVPRDFTRAFEAFRQAADLGSAEAQFFVGYMLAQGEGAAKSPTEAVQWYRRAAHQGHVKAQYNLADAYLYAKGAPTNYLEALQWFGKAAELGLSQAYLTMGNMHFNGQGIPVNFTEAIHCYRKAAELGDAKALYLLASKYETGRGVSKDRAEALRLYKLSAQKGNEEARSALTRLGQR
jgi:TPR repeat protein